jgi:hypothetical protein
MEDEIYGLMEASEAPDRCGALRHASRQEPRRRRPQRLQKREIERVIKAARIENPVLEFAPDGTLRISGKPGHSAKSANSWDDLNEPDPNKAKVRLVAKR